MMEFEEEEEREEEEEEEEEEEDNEEEEEEEEDKDDETLRLLSPCFKKQYSCFSSRYRECLKNHAVSIGGHAVDGCGEFMAGGAEGSLDALKCAACNCHRNFHRKELIPTAEANEQKQVSVYTPRPPPPPPHVFQFYSPRPQSGAEKKKRHRTKFSQEQKDRMFALAERLGWRIQKQDECLIQQFCEETRVERHVLKVWMHNNKHTLPNKPLSIPPPPPRPP